jgi:outer membrane protein TolC
MLAMFLLVAAVHAFAADAPLTLAEAQRLALERSRAVVAEQAAVASARDMAVAAGQLPDPVATMGVNNMPVNGPDAFTLTRDFMTMTSIGVMQEFTRQEKRDARAARFEREADQVLAEKNASVASIQRDVSLAWLDRFYAEAMLAVVAEQNSQARAEVDAAETAYRAGRGNLQDVLAARSGLAALDDRASELGRRARAARITLARWVGDAADQPLADKPDMGTIRLDPRDLDAEVAHHPQMMVYASKEALAAAEVRTAEANKKPDWSLAVMYSQRGSQYSNMVSINVSVPLQWDQANRQDRELASKLKLLDQARAEREDMLRAHAAEMRAMIAEWENDRERSTRYVRELVPLANERAQATIAAYRGGKASLTDVLFARRNEIDVRLQALQLEMDTARLWAQLNFQLPEGDAAPSTHAVAEGTR